MCRIADAEQSRSVPLPEAIHRDFEFLHLAPIIEAEEPVAKTGLQVCHSPLQRRRTIGANDVSGAGRDGIGELPVLAAVDRGSANPVRR